MHFSHNELSLGSIVHYYIDQKQRSLYAFVLVLWTITVLLNKDHSCETYCVYYIHIVI